MGQATTYRREIKVAILVSAIIALGFVSLIAAKLVLINYYRIPQSGMYPSMPAGSLMFAVRRSIINIAEIKRGDIIVFVHETNGRPYNLVWRVIGLPNDKIEVSNKSIIINGEPVEQTWIRDDSSFAIFRERLGDLSYEVAFDKTMDSLPPDVSLEVSPEHFFVMGDNRFHAWDSRQFGCVSYSSIIAKKL